MEKKAKIWICKCGNWIPPRSDAKICLDCMDAEEKFERRRTLKKKLMKLEVKKINTKQKRKRSKK